MIEERVFIETASSKDIYANTFNAIGKYGALVSSFDLNQGLLTWAEGTSYGYSSSHEFNDSQVFSFNVETGETRHLSKGIQNIDYFSYSVEEFKNLDFDIIHSWKNAYRPVTNGEDVFTQLYYTWISQPNDANPDLIGESVLKYDASESKYIGASSVYIPKDFTSDGEYDQIGEHQYAGNNLATIVSTNGISDNTVVINELDSGEQHIFTVPGAGDIFDNNLDHQNRLHVSRNAVAWQDDWGRAFSFNTATNKLTTIEGTEEYGYDGGIDIFLANDKWLITDDISGLGERYSSHNNVAVANLESGQQFVLSAKDIFPGYDDSLYEDWYLDLPMSGIQLVGNKLFGSAHDVIDDVIDIETGEKLSIDKWGRNNDSYSFFEHDLVSGQTTIIVPDKYLLPSGTKAGWEPVATADFASNDKNVIAWQAHAGDMDGFQMPEKEFLPGYEANAILAYNLETGELKRITDEVIQDNPYTSIDEIVIDESGKNVANGSFMDSTLTVAADIWNPEYGEELGYARYVIKAPNAEANDDNQFAEYSSALVNHQWQEIQLSGNYVNPVVIASDPTRRGGDPAVVRLRNIDSNSFQIRLQEPNYKDGYHTNETISYMVVEEGTWELSDGTKLEAGSLSTNKLSTKGRETVSFDDAFGSDDSLAVLSQTQTFYGSDWVTTRTDNITGDSFQVMMQEEERLNGGGHVTESIGWLAIEQGSATDGDTIIEGGVTADRFTHKSATHSFDTSFSSTPTLLTKLDSFDGRDTANSRIRSVNANGFTALIAEEQSRDREIYHTTESISYLALGADSGFLTGVAI
ncbi:hypothetical protein [Synechococcus sp. WH 7805]|uniref:hypothetical protein n=1 Tax=Synechococcus sp. (strain WH7805) TaxID=59931 RepID=UPI000311EC7A|nr:hypothetical protein [Synechococcus sp. WH 7805]